MVSGQVVSPGMQKSALDGDVVAGDAGVSRGNGAEVVFHFEETCVRNLGCSGGCKKDRVPKVLTERHCIECLVIWFL